MTPEALRRRMAHGNIYPPEKVDAALGNYFRVGNLAALRELALLWVADRVDEALQDYRERHGIAGRVGDTRARRRRAHRARPSGERLIRRAARMADAADGELIGVHVRAGRRARRAARRRLLERTARCSRSSAARTTRSSAATSREALVRVRPGRERAPSSSSAPAAGRGGPS